MLRKNEKQAFTKVLILVAVVALALSMSLPGWGEISLDIDDAMFTKMKVKVFGKTYSEWSAEWLLWAAKIPADQNPLFGEGEVDISIGQEGKVWFLAGSWVGPVERIGEVPQGKALFFPIFNLWAYNGPGETYTEEELRDIAVSYVDLVDDVNCTVDGASSAISYPTVRQQSPAFGYTSELLGDTELAVSDGYFVMLPPLPVGEHVVHFDGGITDIGWLQDVTYYITVVEDDD
ncbi:MAG: hypothetical protein ACYSUY_00400 [Planctomycetota bacterium]|jgi:hypothetical protein